MIIIQTRGRKKNTLGWHAPKRWQNGEPEAVSEITICAEALSDGLYEIADTVVHEMVHAFNHANGIKDVSGGQYHNRKFADLAETVGLVVSKGSRGFAYTSPQGEEGKAFRDWVDSIGIDASVFNIVRIERRGAKAPTKMKKWTCGCGTNVRCAVELAATCDYCGTPFVRQS